MLTEVWCYRRSPRWSAHLWKTRSFQYRNLKCAAHKAHRAARRSIDIGRSRWWRLEGALLCWKNVCGPKSFTLKIRKKARQPILIYCGWYYLNFLVFRGFLKNSLHCTCEFEAVGFAFEFYRDWQSLGKVSAIAGGLEEFKIGIFYNANSSLSSS